MDTTVRNHDERACRALRARAVLEGRTAGDLISEAILMERFLDGEWGGGLLLEYIALEVEEKFSRVAGIRVPVA